ncbi:MAG: VOC family protein [Planctomycetes bacterium]|nr:VOC family protein [Planctomycetota bacterium]
MTSWRGISALTLATHDMARAVAFYEALGMPRVFGGPDARFTSLRCGTGFVNLQLQPSDVRWTFWGRAVLHVATPAEVDRLHALALAAGALVEHEPRHAAWGERYFHLRDPDGHELSVACPLG